MAGASSCDLSRRVNHFPHFFTSGYCASGGRFGAGLPAGLGSGGPGSEGPRRGGGHDRRRRRSRGYCQCARLVLRVPGWAVGAGCCCAARVASVCRCRTAWFQLSFKLVWQCAAITHHRKDDARKGLKKAGRYMFTLYDIPRAATAKSLLFPVLSI
jgi:hypothetical protein